mmetsp:Transcript_520/g.1061  ORF Transcript_520/g.1061 Transcript_520/m.1061 type:complete len:320 (-) Transcript_520:1194-2153(-)
MLYTGTGAALGERETSEEKTETAPAPICAMGSTSCSCSCSAAHTSASLAQLPCPTTGLPVEGSSSQRKVRPSAVPSTRVTVAAEVVGAASAASAACVPAICLTGAGPATSFKKATCGSPLPCGSAGKAVQPTVPLSRSTPSSCRPIAEKRVEPDRAPSESAECVRQTASLAKPKALSAPSLRTDSFRLEAPLALPPLSRCTASVTTCTAELAATPAEAAYPTNFSCCSCMRWAKLGARPGASRAGAEADALPGFSTTTACRTPARASVRDHSSDAEEGEEGAEAQGRASTAVRPECSTSSTRTLSHCEASEGARDSTAM